jgi:dihydroorotate dehydrogenase electron transfer subunit
MKHPDTRNSIFVEYAELLSRQAYEGEQYVFRLRAAEIATHAQPGSFVHLQCDKALPMRRPFSIMRANPNEGWIDILFKVYGKGTRMLAARSIGDVINLLGPIGQPFKCARYRRRPLMIGGGVGLPPMIFLAEHIKKINSEISPLVLIGSEIPFPFQPRPSQIIIPAMPNDIIATMPLLDDWGIPCRLTSLQGFTGCYEGYVTDLAKHWINQLDPDQKNEVEILACGPMPMLAAVAQLAREFNLPCQVSLEEHMACGVGGCAGCTVLADTADGPAMKRVCVDGPVFDAASVFPAN